jgi:PLD-like domain
MSRRPRALGSVVITIAIGLGSVATAGAQERLCDNSFEDCRTPILQMIRAETVGIDVSFWFMDDARYANEIVKRWQAGVPVRILVDPRADENYPHNAQVRQSFITAGIPIRYKATAGINHWKMILYAGQNKMHFSAANFSDGSYSPILPYTNYVDEAVYFTDDPTIVQSFMTRYDDIWTDTSNWANLANVNGPLLRNYPTFPISPDLNFPPDQSYQNRLAAQIKLETQQIDAVMFRITSGVIPDALIARHNAGVNVRLITDQRQYRNPSYFWDSYNVDRMYVAGIPIKWKDKTSEQDMHQKSVVLYSRDMAVFGSSNWTAASSDTQREHNFFTTKAWFVDWLKAQFTRKWANTKAPASGGGAISPPVFLAFAPLPPDTPVYSSPANLATGQGASVTLKWEGGYWAHKYDIYFGASSTPPLLVQDFAPGSATAGVRSTKESFVISNLQPGTTYYWRIVSKTMANKTKTGSTWSFTTSGGASTATDPESLILADAYVRAGTSAATNFGTAAELVAKFGTDPQYVRESYLKLDISDVTPGKTVTLRLYGRLSDTRAASVTTNIYKVADTSWAERGITWNTKPTAGPTVQASVVLSGTASQWYSVNLTTFIQAERAAGKTSTSIALKNTTDTLPYVSIASRESTNKPQLVITP